MIAKQLKEPTKQAEEQLRKILKEKAEINSDGFFLRQEDFKVRTLDDRIAARHITEVPLNNLMVHFRMASAGIVSEDNVHGWEFGDWSFFHNGSVSDLVDFTTGARLQEKTDSLEFFEELFSKLSHINSRKDQRVVDAINATAKEHSFFGRAVLYNQITDKMYLFGDFEVYMIANSYLVISSASIFFTHDSSVTEHGFNFSIPQTKLIGRESIDGIGVIQNFHRPGFRYKNLGKLEKRVFTTVSTTPSYNRDHTGRDRGWDEFEADPNYSSDADSHRRTHNTGTHIVRSTHPVGTRPILGLPTPIILSPEKEEMADNIRRVVDGDSCGIGDNNGVVISNLEGEIEELGDDPITQLKEGLYEIQAHMGYIGYDIEGNQVYLDENAIHRVDWGCHTGRNGKDTACMTLLDLPDIQLEVYNGDYKDSPQHISNLLAQYALPQR